MSETEPKSALNSDPAAAAKALATIITALEPLSAEDRQRTISAASVFYGVAKPAPAPKQVDERAQRHHQGDEDHTDHPQHFRQWVQKYNVSADELDRAFHFGADGAFDIHDVPGKSKKDKTLNTYVLTGLGHYLASATGERDFTDATARQFCEKIGCYDQANHAGTLKNHKGGEFSGDKSKGYSLTNVGLKNGAALVKELAGGASS
jgi:hypothetical protein